jgi:hypothetical protein
MVDYSEMVIYLLLRGDAILQIVPDSPTLCADSLKADVGEGDIFGRI